MRFLLTLISFLFITQAHASEYVPHTPECHTLQEEIAAISSMNSNVTLFKTAEDGSYAVLESLDYENLTVIIIDPKTKCTAGFVFLTPVEYELQFGTGV